MYNKSTAQAAAGQALALAKGYRNAGIAPADAKAKSARTAYFQRVLKQRLNTNDGAFTPKASEFIDRLAASGEPTQLIKNAGFSPLNGYLLQSAVDEKCIGDINSDPITDVVEGSLHQCIIEVLNTDVRQDNQSRLNALLRLDDISEQQKLLVQDLVYSGVLEPYLEQNKSVGDGAITAAIDGRALVLQEDAIGLMRRHDPSNLNVAVWKACMMIAKPFAWCFGSKSRPGRGMETLMQHGEHAEERPQEPVNTGSADDVNDLGQPLTEMEMVLEDVMAEYHNADVLGEAGGNVRQTACADSGGAAEVASTTSSDNSHRVTNNPLQEDPTSLAGDNHNYNHCSCS